MARDETQIVRLKLPDLSGLQGLHFRCQFGVHVEAAE